MPTPVDKPAVIVVAQLHCSNDLGTSMSFVGRPSSRLLSWLAEQAAEIRRAQEIWDATFALEHEAVK